MDKNSIIVAFTGGISILFSSCSLIFVLVFIFYTICLSVFEIERFDFTTQNIRTTRSITINLLLFLAGFTLSFVVSGSSQSICGSISREFYKFFKITGGFIMILFAFYTALIMKVKKIRYKIYSDPRSGFLYLACSLIIGMTSSFFLKKDNCLILSEIKRISAIPESILRGIILLLIYSAGIIIPALIISFLTLKIINNISRKVNYIKNISILFSIIIIIIMGLSMFF